MCFIFFLLPQRTEARPHRTFNTVSINDINKIRDLLINNKYVDANKLAASVTGWKDGGESSKQFYLVNY
jgi:hypothetical protein